MSDRSIKASARALLTGLIDYAGLYPPAALDMRTAVRNYVEYSAGPHAWILGRFVVGSARLAEFREAAGDQKIPLSVLVDVTAIGDGGFDTIEVKASTTTQIHGAAERLPKVVTAYFEIPTDGDPKGMIAAIAEEGARAKVRTGGVTANAFPGSRDLARFMECCAEQEVPFKATAGLHHPVRGVHTLAPGASESAMMHGFLNVFVAAAMLRAGEERQKIVRVLEDQSAASFRFEDDAAHWRDDTLDVSQIEDARCNLAIAFGSCSFEEPVAYLKELAIL